MSLSREQLIDIITDFATHLAEGDSQVINADLDTWSDAQLARFYINYIGA